MTAILEGYDAGYVARVSRVLEPVTRLYFRYRLRGTERIPDRPALFVCNHSGLGTAELLCMIPAFFRLFGDRREARGLMMDLFLKWPGMRGFWRKVGALPASPENGRAAIGAGHDVFVFPGGDIDTCRPFYEPRSVHFGSRRGYVRLALETGVPVVPVATIGSHWSWLMLPGGGAIARLFDTKRRFRIERLPLPVNALVILLAFALLLLHVIPVWLDVLVVLAALLPTPARITQEILAPIDLAKETAHLETLEEKLEHGHELVYGKLAHAVRTMEHDTAIIPEAQPTLESASAASLRSPRRRR